MAIYQSNQLEIAVQALKRDECIGFPTETVYGLAGNALHESAILKIFELKKRPFFDPLIVHVSPSMDLTQWVELLPLAKRLMDDFWPGPLTLLLPKKPCIPDLITSGLSTVAVRCPNHPVALEILDLAQMPLAAPSANPFGRISPTSALDVEKGLGEALVIVDGGACTIGVESTIIDVSQREQGDEIKILRRGGISEEDLRRKGYTHISYPAPLHAQSPGTLKSHYAPIKPLYLLKEALDPRWKEMDWVKTTGVLSWQKPWISEGAWGFRDQAICLTPRGDDREAASRLFAQMRRLDESDCERILVEPIPEFGLCAAILDRLSRASVGEAVIGVGGEVILGIRDGGE